MGSLPISHGFVTVLLLVLRWDDLPRSGESFFVDVPLRIVSWPRQPVRVGIASRRGRPTQVVSAWDAGGNQDIVMGSAEAKCAACCPAP